MLRSAGLFHVLSLVALGAACGGKHTTPPPAAPPASTVRVGDCGDPLRDGIVGGSPTLRHADRDLNGDEVDETIVADADLCNAQGDCHWNVFVADDLAGCRRYAGTIQAIGIERLPGRGDRGFADLRAVWALTGDGRFLVQEYRFRRGGYQVTDALLCRQGTDDQVVCTAGR